MKPGTTNISYDDTFRRAARLVLALAALVLLVPLVAGAQSQAETRVLNYIRDNLKPGQPLQVSDLYSKVFTQPADRQALTKLDRSFSRLPLFLAQYQQRFGKPPSLATLAQQFDLKSPGAAEVLLRVMESDPHVPRFAARNPKTGEITGVDVKMLQRDPQFGEAVGEPASQWEGKLAPAFKLDGLDNPGVDSAALSGKLVLLYIWFTGCPPCLKEAPALVELQHNYEAQGLEIVGANADQTLGLNYSAAARRGYVREAGINFPIVSWNPYADAAFGHVVIFPSLFLIDRNNKIVSHWIGYTPPEDLKAAIEKELEKK